MQRHATNKNGLEYNKQTIFSKKTKFASSKKVNLNKVSKKKNIVHPKPKAKTCHYSMKKGHTSYKCYMLGDLMFLEASVFGFPKN